MNKKFLLANFLIFLVLGLGIFSIAKAQNNEGSAVNENDQAVEQMIQEDETVTAQDLGVKEPTILPDNPLYFFKNIFRRISDAITFDPTKKLEKRLRWANERVLELRKLAITKKDPKILEKASEQYQKEIDQIKALADRIDEKKLNDKQKARLNDFLDKLSQQEVLHQRILEKLQNQVPPQVFEKIKEVRERHLKRFGEVMNRLEKNPERLRERLERNLEKIRGSQFKDLKNLDFLKKLEEKMPPEKREALQRLQERFQERIQKKLQQLPEIKKKQFLRYLEKTKKDPEEELNTIQRLNLDQKLPLVKEQILQRIQTQAQKLHKMKGCPEWTLPGPGFCEEGKIIIRRDEKGCPLPPICISPDQIQEKVKNQKGKICFHLWDPVCGKDGKTYSNECWAKVAGVEIAHKGICESTIKKCAKAGEKVNRNPLLGPTSRVCCPGLIEVRVSRSYSVCKRPLEPRLECKTDNDCPQPQYPGIHSKCVNGRCTISIEKKCKTDKDCPQVPQYPGIHPKCVNGRCIVSVP